MKLTINETEYTFRFTIGFLQKLRDGMVASANGVKAGFGDTYYINGVVIDRDVLALREVLLIANKANGGKLKANALDAYLEDESTDIDKLFDEVIAELQSSNVTSSKVKTALATAAD